MRLTRPEVVYIDKMSYIEIVTTNWDFPGGSVGKECAFSAGDLGLIPESGKSPGEGNVNPLQYSCLKNSMDRRSWWAMVHGVAKSQTLGISHQAPLKLTTKRTENSGTLVLHFVLETKSHVVRKSGKNMKKLCWPQVLTWLNTCTHILCSYMYTTYLRNIAGLVPDYWNEVNIAVK